MLLPETAAAAATAKAATSTAATTTTAVTTTATILHYESAKLRQTCRLSDLK